MSIVKSIDECTYKRIKKHIALLIKNSPKNNFVYPHIYHTEKWIIKLRPNADLILKIAALLHDIDRAFIKNRIKDKNIKFYKSYKSKHANSSFKIAKKILEELKLSKKMIHKVLFLIKYHEYGIKNLKHPYRQDINTLMDADSLAFFEELNQYFKTWGKKATENKIKYTWARLSSNGKGIAKKRFFKKLRKLGLKAPDKV